MKSITTYGVSAALLALMAAPAWAQSAASLATDTAIAEPTAGAAETAFIFNTLSFLLHGVLVMFMAAGFAMLEAGCVRTKNVSAIILKNIALYSLAGVMFYLVGYNLMYDGDNSIISGYMGSFSTWSGAEGDAAVAAGDWEAAGSYAAASDWFFQMVFVGTAASIVSGAVAERVRLWSFLAFVAVLTAVIYPVQGFWLWGQGWLSEAGFSDFAGSTLVHSCGGWAALMGVLVLGARKGRFNADGSANPLPGSSIPLVALGTFVLWFGWFGFNGGSQLALGSAADARDIANIYVNTNAAAAGGVLAAMILSQILFGKVDLFAILNGALGGLVSITAEPLMPTIGSALLIGAVGGCIVVLGTSLLLKLKLDDVVGAIPVHLFCGIWGTMAVPLSNPDTAFATQATGVLAIGAFVSIASLIVWGAIAAILKLRSSDEAEELGLDQAELGHRAYPEFVRS